MPQPLMPASQWGRHLMMSKLVEQQLSPGTTSQQDYEYAENNGFKGSFIDFLQYTHPPSPVTMPYGASVTGGPSP
jgi:hypothetical protein